MRTRLHNSSSNSMSSDGHRTVLLHEAIDALDIHSSDVVVDATLGGAGHAKEIVKLLDERGMFIGFDLDRDALDRAREALAGSRPRLELIESNFREMQSALVARDITHIDRALFDLGWSSFQLAVGRGFSIHSEEPLVMTYSKDTADGVTADMIVNEWEESSIADIIYGWGEERYSRMIAAAIVDRRKRARFTTAKELADFIKEIVPSAYAHGRIHPATKTFQALRIAVNDEMGSTQDGFEAAWKMLVVGGRIAVISFHSIEDRLVKQLCVAKEELGTGKRITRKVQKPSDEEIEHNPRARSAKLRVIEKIS